MQHIAGQHSDYQIHDALYSFVNDEVLPHTGHAAPQFWRGVAGLFDTLAGRSSPAAVTPTSDSASRLESPVPSADCLFGPQLEAPLTNARITLNAANARWGSLYDALYGTDTIPHSKGLKPCARYNPARGSRVIRYARDFLDNTFPLNEGSHQDVTGFMVYFQNLMVVLADGTTTGLANPKQFVALSGPKSDPCAIVLKNNDLHVELQIDRNGTIGSRDLAGIQDILVEAATTTIVDCENHGQDPSGKIDVYRNWLGLMRGDLSSTFDKSGRTVTRRAQPDRVMTGRDGEDYCLRGRSLLMMRNASAEARTTAVQDHNGQSMPEGILDAVITALIGSIDLQQRSNRCNSRDGSIYIVKSDIASGDQLAFNCRLLEAVERLIDLPAGSLKLSVNNEQAHTLAMPAEAPHRRRIVRTSQAVAASQSGAPGQPARASQCPAPTPSAAVLHALQFHRQQAEPRLAAH